MEETKKKPDETNPEGTPPAEDPKVDEPKAAEAAPDAGKADEPKEEPKSEGEPKTKDEPVKEDPDAGNKPAEEPVAPAKDEKDEEILRLKTQLEAMKLGISADYLEDAVAIADSYIRNGKANDINTALAAVAKKYPNMKSEAEGAKKGGFKVGAESAPKETNKSDDKYDVAFGIKKKK